MKWLAGALVVVLAAAALAAAWLLGTEPGLRWAATRVEAAMGGKLALDGLRGALARDIRFANLRFTDGDTRVELADGQLRLELLAFLGGRAGIRELRAARLEIALAEARQAPSAAPSVPLGLRIDRAEIRRIEFRGQVVEDFRLRDAVLSDAGAVSAAVSFRVAHGQYPADVALQLGGSLERLDARFSGTVTTIPVSGRALVAPGAPQPLAAIEAQAGPADLRRLNPAWPVTSLTLRLRGKPGPARLNGSVTLANAAAGPLDEERVPIASAQAAFSTDFASLSLGELRVALAPGGVLSGSGSVSAERAVFDLRAAEVDLRSFRTSLRETRLAGPLHLTLERETQSVKGTLAHAGMTLSADVVRTGELVDIRSLRAAANGGVASGAARLRLGEPLRFDTRLRLAGFDPARFGDYPAGSISGSLEARGALADAPDVDARWDIADSTWLGRPFSSRGRAHVSGRRVTGAQAQATLGSAQVTLRGDFGRADDALSFELEAPQLAHFLEEVSGRLRASGTLTGTWDEPRARVQARASALRLPGGVALAAVSAKAEGTLAQHAGSLHVEAEEIDLEAGLRGGWRPTSGWSGHILTLRNAGRYPLELSAPVPLELSREAAKLGRLAARLGQGRLVVDQARWSDGSLATTGEFQRLPAQWLLLAGGLTERLRASLLLDGAWDLRATPRLSGTLSLQRAAGDVTLLQDEPLALGLQDASLKATFDDGRVAATGEVESKYATASLAARIEPVPDAPGLGITPQSQASLRANVRFAELRALTQPLLTDARLEGRLAAEIQAEGPLAQLRLTGKLTGDAIGLDVPPYGVFLDRGELRAVLEGDALRISHFSIRAGEGRLTAEGKLPLRANGEAARLAWRAEQFRLLARPNLRLTVSGAGEAQLVDKRVSLSGELRADHGFVDLELERLPQLGDDVVIVGQPPREARERVRVPLALDVLLSLGERLEVRGHGLEGKLTGKLQIETTPDGELRAYGRIETVNATFLAYGQRLDVDPGVATFDGPIDNPTLQMTAWRRNQQVEAGVQVTGTARNPRVQIVSQPPVPEGERLSWLVLGRAPGDATKADLGLLQAAAGALLSRGDQAPLDRRIANALGVDEISLRGSGEVADRVVAVGKRLSDRLYVSYEQGLGVAASALVKLDLALTQRVSVRAETGTSSGVGLFYRFSWD